MKRYLKRILSAVLIIIMPLAAVYKTSHHSIDFDSITIVDSSKYNLDWGDYALPGPGGYIIACGVNDALMDSANDNSYFYVTLSFFPYIPKDKLSEFETRRFEIETREIRRLSALGLCVFYSDLWEYTGKDKTHIYYKSLTGLLTKEQLLDFPTSNECCYFFDWVTNGDSSRAVPDLEMLDELY